jgi:hypothetical protein
VADQHTREWLADAKVIPRDGLSPADRISLDVFIDGREREIKQALGALCSALTGGRNSALPPAQGRSRGVGSESG